LDTYPKKMKKTFFLFFIDVLPGTIYIIFFDIPPN
jgi:hypothetical protein